MEIESRMPIKETIAIPIILPISVEEILPWRISWRQSENQHDFITKKMILVANDKITRFVSAKIESLEPYFADN